MFGSTFVPGNLGIFDLCRVDAFCDPSVVPFSCGTVVTGLCWNAGLLFHTFLPFFFLRVSVCKG